MVKVLIADDHIVVREGLKQILAKTSDIVVADEASNGQEVLKKVWEKEYDMVLLDISMPGRSGLEILKQLKKEMPNLRVLILSIHSEDQYAMRALKLGASGYLTKESTPYELITAIREISMGKKYITSSLAEKLAYYYYLDTKAEKPLHEILSDREYEVMLMIASGKTVKEIAEELSLSAKTISTYRIRILEKLGMKNNAQLTHYVIKEHLVP
jgi:DNA-binding NarL/FixJ family response regulator